MPFTRYSFFRSQLCVLFFFLVLSCQNQPSSHQQMRQILERVRRQSHHHDNIFAAQDQLRHCDSLLKTAYSEQDKVMCGYMKARALLMTGQEQQAIDLLEELNRQIFQMGLNGSKMVTSDLALAYLRSGERSNCVLNHSGETCILPIQGSGIHANQTGSRKAAEIYRTLAEKYPDDLTTQWLLNLTYMTLGEHRKHEKEPFYLPGMLGDTTYRIRAFEDVAAHLGLDVNNMAGGSIVEDFDNDGYLDLVTSSMGLDEPMHFFKNNADGTFSDQSEKSGLKDLTGGLNMMQTDYNNDGYLDIFVLRGGWFLDRFGNQPNSLLRNNGDGTFTDVTTGSGLLSFHPTQTATWNDYNNDGWVDVFIGNESRKTSPASEMHPCELYLNNQDGTFTNIAQAAGCAIVGYVKGVTSGDYNNDGWKDLFLSTMDGNRYLLRNKGVKAGVPHFEDVTAQAGLGDSEARTFPTWFWDYDNDGWLDILVCDYSFEKPLSYYTAAEALRTPVRNAGIVYLYRNNHDGTFTNVSKAMGLNRTAFAMGSNFGDIDNDGYLDMYLGTGNPAYESLVPNKLFKNLGGRQFADVTVSGRVGHLQKGHGVSFADLDNDGDQDLFIEMGGAFIGDAYPNSLFLNPGQIEANHWLCIQLEGAQANRSAIGSRLKLTFRENGQTRSVYREVNSGGSFGASPLRREMGIGQATVIDELEIEWHGSGNKQVFRNIRPNQFLKIREGRDQVEVVHLKTLNFKGKGNPHHPKQDQLCAPIQSI